MRTSDSAVVRGLVAAGILAGCCAAAVLGAAPAGAMTQQATFVGDITDSPETLALMAGDTVLYHGSCYVVTVDHEWSQATVFDHADKFAPSDLCPPTATGPEVPSEPETPSAESSELGAALLLLVFGAGFVTIGSLR